MTTRLWQIGSFTNCGPRRSSVAQGALAVPRRGAWLVPLWKGPPVRGAARRVVSRKSRRTARADRTKICFRKHSDICFCKHSDVVCWPWPNTAAAFGHLLPQVFSDICDLPPQVFCSLLYTPPGTARADWASNHFIHFVHRVSPTLEGRRREMQLSLSRVSTVGPPLAVLCVEPDCIKFIVSAVFTRCGGILQGEPVVRHCGHNGLAQIVSHAR